MLDPLAVEVDHVQRVVGTRGDIHRMKPWIARCQELALRIGASGDERCAVRQQLAAVHEIQ
jgi:hypothetical protein